jgi:adenosylcobyric acid synthase
MMKAREYQEYQSKLIPYIEQSLEELKKSYDLIIIEGAGSPAEVNLYQHDIVNMKIARMTGAPVILVGDIELGGVFASLVGTLELLPPQDRGRVKGFLINKFRGDIAILEPGLRYLEERTGLPVLGILPYDAGLRIEEEDGVFWAKKMVTVPEWGLSSFLENGKWEMGNGKNEKIQIHVVEFPRISNHTDFEPFLSEPDVELRYIREIPQIIPDVLILPGTRSTMADLEFLRRQGLFEFIQEHVQKGMRLIGICGGYQMLGERILDLDHVESQQTQINGLGLFPFVTKFSPKKLTAQVRAVHSQSGEEIKGYEIHMGITQCCRGDACVAPTPVFRVIEQGGELVSFTEGAISDNRRVWGSYIHGLFDAHGFRRYFLNQIRVEKGWSPLDPKDLWERSIQFDRLAEMIRQHVKMESIYEWLGFTNTLGNRCLSVGSFAGRS